MNKEEAVKIFDLVIRNRMLPEKIGELIPLSFIGQAAVSFYREKVALMDRLGLAEDQKRETLRDGQDAGRMLLTIEARIGELLPNAEEAQRLGGQKPGTPKGGGGTKVLPPDLSRKRAQAARTIACHPEAVAQVIQEAEENEDIPTKTAVLNKVKADNATAKLKAFRQKHATEPKPELNEYLENCINHIIQINSVVKQFFEYPDQLDPERMSYFIRQVKILVEIISNKSREGIWKQLD